MQESLNRIEGKIDSLHDKVEGHLGRISKLEESNDWTKSHIKKVQYLLVTILLAGVGQIIKSNFDIGG